MKILRTKINIFRNLLIYFLKAIRFCDHNPNPCKNGGICENFGNDFRCACVNNYFGKYCTDCLWSCPNKPCQNNGTCSELICNQFKCVCLHHFRGEYCEIFDDPCANQPCKNGGKCSPNFAIGDYVCTCSAAHVGRHCQKWANPCINPKACENGKSCITLIYATYNDDSAHACINGNSWTIHNPNGQVCAFSGGNETAKEAEFRKETANVAFMAEQVAMALPQSAIIIPAQPAPSVVVATQPAINAEAPKKHHNSHKKNSF